MLSHSSRRPPISHAGMTETFSPVPLSLLLALTLAVSFSSTVAHTAEPYVKVFAHGYAKGHTPQSRESALNDAHRQAVRIWLESTLNEIPEAVLLPILEQADAYVYSSRIVRLEKLELGTEVDAEVYLHEWSLRGDLAASLISFLPTPPRVVFLLGEENVDRPGFQFDGDDIVVSILAKALKLRGVDVVDPTEVRQRYTQRELIGYLRSGKDAIAKFGRENQAHVVVAGQARASARREGPTGGLLRLYAEINLDVLATSSREYYDSVSAQAEVSSANAMEAARVALEDASIKVRDVVLVAVVLASANHEEEPLMQLTVQGVDGPLELDRVAQWLRRKDGVEAVEVLRSGKGVGRLIFDYSGKMAPLVEHLRQPIPGDLQLELVSAVWGELLFRILTDESS